jgi:hypothetical protein
VLGDDEWYVMTFTDLRGQQTSEQRHMGVDNIRLSVARYVIVVQAESIPYPQPSVDVGYLRKPCHAVPAQGWNSEINFLLQAVTAGHDTSPTPDRSLPRVDNAYGGPVLPKGEYLLSKKTSLDVRRVGGVPGGDYKDVHA